MSESGPVYIFDTTLRDGEQSPGVALTMVEKLAIAQQLAVLGVDIIEAGFPAASNGDFEAVEAISREVPGPTIAALARCQSGDILKAAQALSSAKRPRIHVFIATSDVHMRAKLNMTPNEVLDRVAQSVALARQYAEDVEFSAEDATRSDPDFLVQVATVAVQAGARTINLPDTVGYAVPDEYGELVRYVRQHCPGDVIFSVHCHDDLGMAVANSLAGVQAGARQVEVAVNGIGERAGNAALEEVVMALTARADHYGVSHGVRLPFIYQTSQMVSQYTGMPVQPNKAIVGANAFRHESGIHQDGMLKDPRTYEIINPESIGQGSRLVLGKHSGRHALRDRLDRLGLSYTPDQLHRLQLRVKALAESKVVVDDNQLKALWMIEVEGRSEGVV
jgi:2-isopropylmalate synthase